MQVPALWYDAWYDVSIGPNLTLFNHARKAGVDDNVRNNQYAIVGPNVHCAYPTLGPKFKSGDRELGDASFDSSSEVWAFFDRFLKGQKDRFPDTRPKVRYYMMGENKWREADQWPPKEAVPTKLYLASGGRANSMYGDGKLVQFRVDIRHEIEKPCIQAAGSYGIQQFQARRRLKLQHCVGPLLSESAEGIRDNAAPGRILCEPYAQRP